MTVHGNGARITTLQNAGIERAELLIAVTSRTEANILICQVAKHFMVAKTICRVSSHDYFSDEEGFTPEKYGIDQVIFPTDECAKKIIKSINNHEIKEYIPLVDEKAALVSFVIRPESPLYNYKISEFPNSDLINKVRVCAISRKSKLIIPRGINRFAIDDEVYFAGEIAAIEELLEFAFPNLTPAQKIIISGVNPLSMKVVQMLNEVNIFANVIERDAFQAQYAAENLSSHNLVFRGDSNDPRMLEEAGIDDCDIFLSTVNSQNNLFSCLLAKRRGAKKVYAVADQQDTLEIMAEVKAIDTTFSVRVDAVNELLNSIRSDQMKVGALLKRVPAEVKEFEVAENGKIAGKKINEIDCPESTVLALVIRNGEILPAVGDLQLLAGDRIITFADRKSRILLERLFTRRKFF
ncbi:MAG: NAD-binding protein, partial [Lentisphaeria bacterium]